MEYLGTPGRVSVLNLPQWLKILQHIRQIKKSCSIQRPLQPQIITHNLFAFLTVNQIFNVWIYLWHLISFFFFFSEAVGKKWTTSVLCLHLSLVAPTNVWRGAKKIFHIILTVSPTNLLLSQLRSHIFILFFHLLFLHPYYSFFQFLLLVLFFSSQSCISRGERLTH